MEFLLRTRHPELGLTFKRFTTGGGTFATGLEKLDGWLQEFPPSVVFFNYGGNDAAAGEAGLAKFHENLTACVARVEKAGARVVLLTPQAADIRKSGTAPAARRTRYAEDLLAFAREKGWPAIDVHHPLADLQTAGEKDDPAFTILKDQIHLTDPAYVAWAFYLYDRLSPPPCTSLATLTAAGQVTATERCTVTDVKAEGKTLAFTRRDAVLPILPPVVLPSPRQVPLERLSPYLLKVTGLQEGLYLVRCEKQALGVVSAAELAAGINLNALQIHAGQPAPWQALAKELWEGKGLEQIGKTAWRFEVVRQ
jgi:lysophospholipase L1-like esterase